MALNRRQRHLYVHVFQTYRKTRAVNGDWLWAVNIEKLPGYLFATTNADAPMVAGLQKKDLSISEDKIHFDATQDVRGQDLILNITPGHSDNGTWYEILGEPRIREATRTRNTNVGMVYINKTSKPPLTTD